MANTVYPKFLQALLTADSLADLENGTVKVQGVNVSGAGTLYTYNAAHDNLDDVASASRLGSPSAALGSKTITDGVFDAADTSISGSGGEATIEALVIYIDSGTESTSRLVAYLDTVTGLAFTPPAGAWTANVVWDNGANKIFKLG